MHRLFFLTSLAIMLPIVMVKAQSLAPTPELLETLSEQVKKDPQNLDHYFDYAQTAAALGKFDDAIQAYQHMLSVDASLQRVKLDLALLYVRTGRLKEANLLFNEVLDTNPPEPVKRNIHQVMKTVKTELEKHRFSGSIAVGYAFDTNANSAPRSGEVTFLDISLPLEGNNLRQSDGQFFSAATLQYRYRFSHPPHGTILDWNVRGTGYQGSQVNVDTLDIAVLGVKTGPTIELKKYKTKLALEGGYQKVTLDYDDYLNLVSTDLSLQYGYSKDISLFSIFTYEDRHFMNTPNSSTYADRTGNAYQVKFGLNNIITSKDFVSATATLRRENTRKNYLDNDQIDLNTSYTHQFTEDVFINAYAGHRWSFYDGPDAFISANVTRKDKEAYTGLTLGKELHNHIVLSLGYQYRYVASTLQNYEFDNHRTLATIGWSF